MKWRRFYILGFCLLFVVLLIYGLLFHDPRPKQPHVYYSASKTDSGVTISLSNVRLVDKSPQWKMLLVNICVENPNQDSLSINGRIVYPNGEKEIERGISSIKNPSCYDYDFSFTPDDDISQLNIEISKLRNWSYHFNEELVCAMAAEQQRVLDEWKTGIKVSCRENGSSGEWIRQIDFVPSGITDVGDLLNRANEIATDKILITHGTWEFVVAENDIYHYPVLTLNEPDSPLVNPQDITLQVSNLRKHTVQSPLPNQIDYLQMDVCLTSPAQISWGFWDAVLEYGDGILRKRFYVNAGNDENCNVLSFDVLPGDIVSEAHLRILGLTFPPDMSNQKTCNEYLPKLQEAINAKYFGLIAKCVRTSDERGRWGIGYMFKPFWMSNLDAGLLLGSQELYTVRGNWEFDLKLSQ